MRFHRGRPRGESGAAAVEFALVVPILLMVLFAIITFGFLFAQDLVLSNAARQAARHGAVESRTCAEVDAEAVQAAAPLVDTSAMVVDISRGPGAGGGTPCSGNPCKDAGDADNVVVKLTFQAPVMIPVFPGMGDTVELEGRGVFRCE